MEEKNYKYDAFISYRHCDLDKFVAENLHRILENYDLPKNIKEKLNIQGRTIKRVFRDQEELPLSSNLEDPIIEALKNSKYLIVICSPRLKDSLWCKKEIETFKKLRGRKNIFCVLIEGEPSDSFPEEVLCDEEIVNGKKKKKLVEPLAADVRGENKKEVLKKIKSEKLRLIAPMYNLDYDDLRQRHKMQKQRKIFITSLIVAAACLLFALYTTIMLVKINNQKNMLRLNQAETLSQKSLEYIKKDSRYSAVKTSYEALTKFNNVKMPYTSEAEYALSESLGVYNEGSSYKAISEINTKGVVDYIKNSDNNKYVLIYDESEELSLINSKTLKKTAVYNDISGLSFDENSFTFIGNNLFSYINKNGNIIVVNTKNGKVVKEIKREDERYTSIVGASNGKYLAYITNKNLYIYNLKDNKIIGSTNTKDKYINEFYFSEDDKYIFIGSNKDNYDITKEDYLTIHIIETDTVNEINKETLNASYISGMITKNNNVYMLLNRSLGKEFNMIVISYNYIDGNINWSRTFDNNFGKFITKSYPSDSNDLAIVNYDTVKVLNMDNGNVIDTFNSSSEIINIYSYLNKEIYLVFNGDSSVNFINMDTHNSIEYKGKFEFNLDKYSKVVQSGNGFLLVPFNENRAIYYEANSNKELQEENIKLDYPSNDSVKSSVQKKLIKEYDVKNKNLVDNMFYDDKKEILFVNYKNQDIAVYNVKTKELIKLLENVGNIEHYFGKDKYNRTYIGDISDSYILDKNYEKVGHIKSLAKIDSKNNKVIISNNSKYYSIKIYTLNDLLKIAKDYLKQE